MNNKTMKQTRPISDDEKNAQMVRAYLQKKASLAEAILFNMVQGAGVSLSYERENYESSRTHLRLVQIADEMSTEFMKVIYNQEMEVKE